jgi:predicted Zn-dependent protease
MRPLFLALALLIECNPIHYPSSTRSYNVYIDPGFTDEHKKSVRQAFIDWELATQQTVTFVDCSVPDHQQPLMTVLPSKQDWLTKHFKKKGKATLVGEANFRGQDSILYIAEDQGEMNFHQTALHEIGHALGLEHDENKAHYNANVMTESQDNSSNVITCLDLRAFCKIWGCNAEKLPRCNGWLLQ